jgi:hypothetical protein
MRRTSLHRERFHRLAVAIIALFVAVGLSTSAAPSVEAAKPSPSPWSIVSSPNPGSNANDSLRGVTTIATNDVWAVGTIFSNTVIHSIIEHWDGTSWSVVPNAHPGGFDELNGISAVSSDDVWAVGSAESGTTLIEHWNGTSWSIVPSPGVSGSGRLTGLAVVSASDVWAVGYATGNTLIEHWNGRAWSVVPSPNPGPRGNALIGVIAVSASDIWAVGNQQFPAGDGVCARPLTEHWDGRSWSVVSSPTITGVCPILSGVAAVSSTDVWAVGQGTGALVEHWDGKNWSIVSTPSPAYKTLTGVTVLGPKDVWAVGNGGGSGSGSSLTEQWNGTSWSIVSSPNGPVGGALAGVASLPNGTLWAVGNQFTADPYTRVQQTFILRNTTG